MKRYGAVVGVKPEKVARYRELHAAAWPDVLAVIKRSRIQNYSIYLRTLADGRPYRVWNCCPTARPAKSGRRWKKYFTSTELL